ncbi:MAG: phosphotriesterase-related protein [Rubrobacter sp.]|nr:phosphotriesterase-related protein [Rubrobacter sp.]
MATQVNTVTGEVSSDKLGKTLMHEHFIFGYPGYYADFNFGGFDREEHMAVALNVAEQAKSRGVQTIVDATPNDCGRDANFLKEASERGGINIVCSTGYYYENEGAPAYFKFRASLVDAETEIYEMMVHEITEGIGDTGVKAGVIKLASSKDEITPYEAMFFRAGARAQRETGVPIITHTQEGTMGPEQAELLMAEGADPNRTAIGHMDGNTDVSYHAATLAHGVNIAFDRFGVQGIVGAPMDEMRTTALIGLLGMGHGDNILLSHDKVNVWLGRPLVFPEAVADLLKNWHTTHLFDNIVPKLKDAGITEKRIDAIFDDNVQRLFGG